MSDPTQIVDDLAPRVDGAPLLMPGQAFPMPPGLEYEGLLGMGAMGEVHRVRDRQLRRTMALKVLQPQFAARTASLQRFREEAQTTAQLQHPGIVPVHALGTLPDGRLYFTMIEVRGRTLGAVITAVHRASSPHGWGVDLQGTTFRRLVEHLRTASEAVAHAHARGVVHRDIKPDNIMVGAHGEVLVMDWGLARLAGRPVDSSQDPLELEGRADQTRAGVVFGTPAYMPPEQARGEGFALDARADVYALGAVLFAILYGARPYDGLDGAALLAELSRGNPPAIIQGGPPVPEELEAIRLRAMDPEKSKRYPDAGALAGDVIAWLDGSARRERAMHLVGAARERRREAARWRDEAAALRRTAQVLLDSVPGWAGEEEKREVWDQMDDADARDARADLEEVAFEQLLQGALGQDPDNLDARVLLAERWFEVHKAAEASRASAVARRAEAVLRGHVDGLPRAHPVRNRLEIWLRGDSRVSLTVVGGCDRVSLFRFEARHRRLVPRKVDDLALQDGTLDLAVPAGSYLLELVGPGGRVRFPLLAERGASDRIEDPDGRPYRLRIPDVGELGERDVLVPGAWCRLGGDASAIGSGPARTVWVPDFVIRRFPVTNREYLEFLNDLVARGLEADAQAAVPREKAGTVGELGAVIFGREPDGRYFLRADADGDVWEPDHPVVHVSWHGASAFARWEAERTGLPWRLPSADEREKAGRGVDGRFYPWGDDLDPSFCCMRDSHRGPPLFASIDQFPIDESPYGVRGLAGNVRDWCLDEPAPGRHVNRGGFWLCNAREARLADQHDHVAEHRGAEIGLRLARVFPNHA